MQSTKHRKSIFNLAGTIHSLSLCNSVLANTTRQQGTTRDRQNTTSNLNGLQGNNMRMQGTATSCMVVNDLINFNS